MMKKSLRTTSEVDETLPFSSLRLLAPPLRLVSAAMWKVMEHRDVMQYGKLEEFVSSVCEAAPGLLNYRHQAKLTVGLRARLILELFHCSESPDPQIIESHLERVRAPPLPLSASPRKDAKVEMAVENFHALTRALLKYQTERQIFFQEEFHSQYGPQYELALEKLLWEFLTRLDQLLPVPDLTQTVSWLSTAPAVLEECARSASQPQLLRTLLKHEKCLGHLDSTASIPSSTGDTILSSLSLPLSGRVMKQSAHSGSNTTSELVSSANPASLKANQNQRKGFIPPVTPVIGLITSKDLPCTDSANNVAAPTFQEESEEESITEVSGYTQVKLRSSARSKMTGGKGFVRERRTSLRERKIQNVSQTPLSSDEEEEQEVKIVRKTRQTGSTGNSREYRDKEKLLEGSGGGSGKKNKSRVAGGSDVCMTSQEEEGKTALITSCLTRQLRVLVHRLDLTDATVRAQYRRGTKPRARSPREEDVATGRNRLHPRGRKRKLTDHQTPEKDLSRSSEKENYTVSPCIPLIKSLWKQSPVKIPSPVKFDEDIIIDSEDEEANYKGALFTKRYHKTKTNTYIPTLHEFWIPSFVRRDHLSPGNSYR